MFSNKERIVIEIDVDNETYKMDISYCNADRLKAVLEDILERMKTGEFFKEPDLEVTHINN